MIRKRNKFWTVIFAFLPGAGHMYNGFMKLGVSLMGIFFAAWALAAFIGMSTIGLLTPVIWFYAFFDCINKTFLDDEEFYCQEDDYLFRKDAISDKNWAYLSSKKDMIGVILIIVGIFALWNHVFMRVLVDLIHLPNVMIDLIYSINQIVPQAIVAILIIWAGITLIKGKKEEIETGEEEHKKE